MSQTEISTASLYIGIAFAAFALIALVGWALLWAIYGRTAIYAAPRLLCDTA
jgi:hypothetical protein